MSLNFQIAIAVGFGGAFGSILRFYAVDYVHKMEFRNFVLIFVKFEVVIIASIFISNFWFLYIFVGVFVYDKYKFFAAKRFIEQKVTRIKKSIDTFFINYYLY